MVVIISFNQSCKLIIISWVEEKKIRDAILIIMVIINFLNVNKPLLNYKVISLIWFLYAAWIEIEKLNRVSAYESYMYVYFLFCNSILHFKY